ncbi:helix-turn-helix domain-containing protein [Saccharomonospora cyanea]|uniref:Putative transcriptional regulator n=1 Tax=Saccharomonospora cyanea NA-134 TaxID=882082 RepID=H5XKZ4_9PSEU|nr:helix-turn-helix transcriptional regulator [Saccharomonospora cyanea]EHR63026.1 putative transcriptional regulator [Saccharomonospora cyanea NA-134]
MRGAGEDLSIGERVAFYRRRRGLSQAVLAGLMGKSEDWVSKIERGERQVNRIDVVVELARQLRVTLNDLLGEPVLFEDEDDNDDVPAVRDALMSPQRLSRTLFGGGLQPEYVDTEPVARVTEEAWNQYQQGKVGQVISLLPGLLKSAQQLERGAAGRPAYARRAFAVSARIHHLAATTLSKVGEADLSWIAAERAMQAADQSEDALVLASAARAGTHALLAVGRFDEALSLGETAARWMAPELRDGNPGALSLYGMLHLRTAVAAARRQDRRTATELLGQADAAAERLGRDGNYWQTGFGPSNVELHRLSAALDLGDVAHVVERGQAVRPTHLPVERQVTHAIDVARALSMFARDDEALDMLLDAEQKSPQLVRHSSMVREVVRTLYRRAPVSNGKSSPLFGLAERCRAVR